MLTENVVTIKGNADAIFKYAADVEQWPVILPHYRAVEILEGDETIRIVRMHCVRAFGPIKWPCKWVARQELIPTEGRILYEHIKGPTRGMRVEWILEGASDGVRTRIIHELKPRLALLGRLYTDKVVGPLFVHAIAGKTLETIKGIVEGTPAI